MFFDDRNGILPDRGSETSSEIFITSNRSYVEQYGHLTGAGDVVWPAGLAFSRLLVHCPSFVQGKRVLELGAGLGAVGLAAATAGAASVLLTDYDEDVLDFAGQAG